MSYISIRNGVLSNKIDIIMVAALDNFILFMGNLCIEGWCYREDVI